MTTRLEDAVISVRIETGRARSQIQSLRGDLGGQAGQPDGGGFFPPGGTTPSAGGDGGGGGGSKTPGTSTAPEAFGGSQTGAGGGPAVALRANSRTPLSICAQSKT